jgi:hypothetical protein
VSRSLEYFTIGYDSAEGLISLVAGFVAGSVSLIGFGLDSLLEVTSGAALLLPSCSRTGQSTFTSIRHPTERTCSTVGNMSLLLTFTVCASPTLWRIPADNPIFRLTFHEKALRGTSFR